MKLSCDKVLENLIGEAAALANQNAGNLVTTKFQAKEMEFSDKLSLLEFGLCKERIERVKSENSGNQEID